LGGDPGLPLKDQPGRDLEDPHEQHNGYNHTGTDNAFVSVHKLLQAVSRRCRRGRDRLAIAMMLDIRRQL
jgi:hypothetical protein